MKEELLKLGFIENPMMTIIHCFNYFIESKYNTNTVTISDLGTPNEVIAFRNGDSRLNNHKDDLVFLHNFDYHGYISLERIKSLMYGLTGDIKFKT